MSIFRFVGVHIDEGAGCHLADSTSGRATRFDGHSSAERRSPGFSANLTSRNLIRNSEPNGLYIGAVRHDKRCKNIFLLRVR